MLRGRPLPELVQLGLGKSSSGWATSTRTYGDSGEVASSSALPMDALAQRQRLEIPLDEAMRRAIDRSLR